MKVLFDSLLPHRCLNCLIATRYETFCGACENMIKLCPDNDGESMFIYGGQLRSLILRAKFEPNEGIARALARFLDESVRAQTVKNTRLQKSFDCVTYAPSHWKRRASRGFEFSALLANTMALIVGAPLRHLLYCARNDPPQSGSFSANERQALVQGRYFPIKPHPRYKNILVVDDIITTGSTIRACALSLGAISEEVDWFTFAKTSSALSAAPLKQ